MEVVHSKQDHHLCLIFQELLITLKTIVTNLKWFYKLKIVCTLRKHSL